MDFKDRVAVVTGGNSGIGRAIAIALADSGARLLIVARDAAKGRAVCREIANRGGQAAFFSVELGDESAVRALLETVERDYGALHVLVNNAGGGDDKMGIDQHTSVAERWERMSAGNFRSAYLMTTYSVPVMQRTGGAIVNISSTASRHGNYGLYGAMKAGLEGLTRSQAFQLAPLGIRVNAVAPGWIHTPRMLPDPPGPALEAWEKTASLLGRMGRPEEVAEAVLFLLSERASFITGATLFVDGGLSIIDATAAGWSAAMARTFR